ncbi:MAG: hypothetical protein ACE5KJ_01765, partial [Candidatus Zixiibacteriota bacterium]
MLNKRPFLKRLLFILLIFVLASGVWHGAKFLQGKKEPEEVAPSPQEEEEAAETLSTEANLKVAFIGDSGYGKNFEKVLQLIKSERADMVLHQGDFDYALDPSGFFAKIDKILGPKFPYFL